MPRVHPSKLPPVDAPELLDLDDITVKANKQATEKQASESFSVKSSGGDALGVGGETRGFAKKSVVVPKGYTANDDKRIDEFAMNTGFMYKNLDMIDDATLGGDRALLTRAVASYEADKLLGLNTLSQEKFAVGSDGTVMGVSIQADGAAVVGNDGRLDVDYRDPKIQRGLSDLEVSDYITGQTDRHMGNIFIDPKTGKVTGIDNDLAFPEQDRAEVLKVDHGLRTKMAGTMPRVMHKETAEKILKADPEELRTTLSKSPPHGVTPLSKEEIDGAVNRLKELQSELGKGKKSAIKVVSKFDNGTYNAAVKEQENMLKLKEKGSYDHFRKQAMSGNTFASKTVLAAPKTSYIGGVDLAIRVQKMEKPELQKVVKVGPKAERVAEMQPKVAYESLSPKEQQAFDKEFAKLQKMDTQLEKRQQNLQRMENERPDSGGFKAWNANRKIEAEKREIAKLEKQIDRAETRLPIKTTNTKGLEMEMEDDRQPSLKRGESRSLKGTSQKMEMDEISLEESMDVDDNPKPKLSKGKEKIEDGTSVEFAPREVQMKTRDVMSELNSKVKTKRVETLELSEGTSSSTSKSTRESYTPNQKVAVNKTGPKLGPG